MRVRLVQRLQWRGKVTVVPARAGVCRGAVAGGVRLDGIRVGDEVGETTTVQSGVAQAVVVSLGDPEKLVTDTFRRVGGAVAKWMTARDVTRAGVDTAAALPADGNEALAALCEGLVLGAFRFDEHKSSAKRRRAVGVDLLVRRLTKPASDAVVRGAKVADAANLARQIAHQPPNVINPVTLAARVRRLARQWGLKCTVIDERQMARMKMGGILAVGQGSDSPPRLILLEYRGRGGGRPVVLVGKAITFDTGGYSIKPKDGILGMKYDKCGAMAVLGTMKAAAALKLKTPVIGVIAAAENMISGGAYRPDDIITTLSGKTVEIVSADAEGRLVLCDALTHVQRQYKPRAVIDIATLTGGVVIALGKLRAGIFSNDDALRDALIESGARTHERLWPLPLDEEYLDLLKGTDSDLKNSAGRDAHAVQGAIFLKQFIERATKWAHLDIAGVADVDKDQLYCPKGATGFGVRLLTSYIEGCRAESTRRSR